MYHHLDENSSSSSTQQVQVGVLQHFSLNSTVCCIEKYSTQQVPTAVHPPTYLYMACSYMESNSVLVADGNTTSVVSPTRGGARPNYVWTAESPTKRVHIFARLPNKHNHRRRGYILKTRAWPLP